MHAQDLLAHQRRQRHSRERVLKDRPHLDPGPAQPSGALVVESVDFVDGRTLVIAAKQEEIDGKYEFVGQQHQNRLEILPSTVHVVAQEQVVGACGKAGLVEEAQKVWWKW